MARKASAAKIIPLVVEAAPPLAKISQIKLGTDLGIEEAGQLHGLLIAAIDEPGTVELQADEVCQIHTAALELFCLFWRDRRNAGRETRWLAPSETLRGVAALMGMTNLLALGQNNETMEVHP